MLNVIWLMLSSNELDLLPQLVQYGSVIGLLPCQVWTGELLSVSSQSRGNHMVDTHCSTFLR